MPWAPGSGEKKPEMSHRPLIPALLSFVAGIMIGRLTLPYDQFLIFPIFFLISITLIVSTLITSASRQYLLLLTFVLLGLLLTLNSKNHFDLSQPALERKKVILEGTVLTPARTNQDITTTEVKAERLLINDRVDSINEKVSVNIYENPPDIAPGQRIRFPATLRAFRNFNNQGSYDYRLARELKDFSCGASVSNGRYIVPMGKGNLGFPFDFIEHIRRHVRHFLGDGLADRNQALYRALILGEQQAIDYDLRESFNVMGLGHVLAVSGLHVGLVAWFSFFLVRWLMSLSYTLTLRTDIKKVAAVVTCFPVVAYACLAGFQVSTQRAMIMVITYLFSILIGREREIWSTLALAAIMVLAIDPDAIFTISFQLSFGAVIGIIWLSPGIINMVSEPFSSGGRKNIFSQIYFYVTGLIVITLTATIFLMPLTTFYFHRISVVSILANLMVIPILGFWILPLGLISSVLLYIIPSAAGFLLKTGSYGLDVMMNIIQFWSHYSWASFWTVMPNLFEIVLFYCLIFCICFIRGRRWAKIGLALVLLICLVDVSYWIYQTRFNRHLRVTYLDVGQGNSALIQFPGRERLLIDGGGFLMSNSDVGRMVVAPFLFHSKILKVDYLALTHPDSDHMNGLIFIASNFEPREFWFNGDRVDKPAYNELMGIIESKKIKILLPSEMCDREREISGVKIELLHPLSGDSETGASYEDTNLNNNSLVLKITYNGTSFLFPGDIEREAEEALLSRAAALKSDILLVPHHGSKGSSTMLFLRAVSPKICVISSGSGNRFGFPHKETMDRLRETGATIMRVDESGAIEFKVGEGGRYEIKTFIE
jgi:competence protein ComEC